MLSGVVEPPVKYHSLSMYFLTPTAKTAGDSIWWVVLVGRYPETVRRGVAPAPLAFRIREEAINRGSPIAISGQTSRYMLEQPEYPALP